MGNASGASGTAVTVASGSAFSVGVTTAPPSSLVGSISAEFVSSQAARPSAIRATNIASHFIAFPL